MARWVVWRRAGGNTFDEGVVCGLVKEDDREAVGGVVLGHNHAVVGGLPSVVGPERHQVAQVDDQRLCDVRDVFPFAIGCLDLQSSFAVVMEYGEAAPVGVFTSPKLSPGLGLLEFGVVVDGQIGDVVTDLVVKPVLVEPESQCHQSHEAIR